MLFRSWLQNGTVIGTNPNIQVCPSTTTNYVAQGIYTICNGTQITVSDTLTVNVLSALQTNIAVTQTINCNNGNNGSALVNVVSGNNPITYQWSNGTTAASANGLSAGTYTVTVTDATGCTNSLSITHTNPPPLLPGAPVIQHVLCNGGNNGTIAVSPSGGTQPYTYAWSNGSSNSSITGLTAGNYSVTITDVKGCTTQIINIAVNQPLPLVVQLAGQNILCNGASTGSINSNVQGGNGSYNFLWSNGSTNSNLNIIAAGTYTVTVTDNNNCTSSATCMITQP